MDYDVYTILETKTYFKKPTCLMHRTDGPAVEYANGNKEWWINGFRLSPEKEAVLNKWLENKNGARII